MTKHLAPAAVFEVVFAVAALLLLATVPAQGVSSTADRTCMSETVSRFLESGQPALTAYRARRHLEASTRGGSLEAQLDAWTNLDPDGTFTFEISRESGSHVIRSHVLRAALLEEQRTHAAARMAEAALTPANYDFRVEDERSNDDLVRIELSPRRKSRMLIAGAALVKGDNADLVRVEGILPVRPSIWTRKVHVMRRYARIEGVRVPVEMLSRASVLLVGESSFSMTYEYTAINGRPVLD